MWSERPTYFPEVTGHLPPLRFVYLGLALLSALVQALIATQAAQDAQSSQYQQSLVGIAMSLLMGVLSNLPNFPMRWIQCGTILVGYAWVLISAFLLESAPDLCASILIGQLIFTTFSFSWLRQRSALLLSSVTYLLLWVPSGPDSMLDRPPLLLTGFAMSLVWFLSQYGWHVYLERNRKEEFAALAFTDYLTGIANRHSGRESLERLFVEHADVPGALCVALCDIDHFKHINDTVGHHRGDDVLIEVARVLQRSVGPQGGHAVRWGGEEFLLILPGHSLAAARGVVDRALSEVREGTFPERVQVTLSAGVACMAEVGDVPGLLRLADQRLYEAKAGGRNRTV
ncbi:diguanylate cyclase domain-containing protein [Deinococcus sp. ME38]|uniref:GGDEF domain-containing protein n=1 Tax=Deinococcus sp. ME38 TaxID=3400344 RepID=UPI003B5BD644